MVGKRIDLKKSNSTFSLAVDNLPGSGGSAAVFRERRRMNVDDFVLRDIDNFLGKKRRTVGNTKPEVGLERFQLRDEISVKSFGLKEGQVVSLGESRNRIGLDLLEAADGLIGFGNNGD